MGTFLLPAVHSELGPFSTEVVSMCIICKQPFQVFESKNDLHKSFWAHTSAAGGLQAVGRVLHQNIWVAISLDMQIIQQIPFPT